MPTIKNSDDGVQRIRPDIALC